ncbi:MAG TPA: ABC transporter ATP-binding protein [Rhodoblastus sp.]|nr:ABC transporter ATP-binding protein [Rhodoblastus sp.]
MADLRGGYGDGEVLSGVSFLLEAGACGCLLGRNGAGKTTVMRSIMGYLKPSAGAVVLDNQPLIGLRPDEIARQGVGYVPEDRGIFPDLTVEENLQVTRASGVRRDLQSIYADFPVLRERRRQRGGTLSGGEQQLLSIARALMGGPRVLLLDEPSEGLAPLVIRGLAREIATLRSAGLTVLIAEQNLEFARSVADVIFVLDRGKICFSGPYGQLEADAALKKRHLFVSHG